MENINLLPYPPKRSEPIPEGYNVLGSFLGHELLVKGDKPISLALSYTLCLLTGTKDISAVIAQFSELEDDLRSGAVKEEDLHEMFKKAMSKGKQ